MKTSRSFRIVRFRIAYIGMVLAIGWSNPQFTVSQIAENGHRLYEKTTFYLNLNGTLSRSNSAMSTTEPERDPLLEVLENEITRSDLKLDPEKWNAIQRDFEAAEKLLLKYTTLSRQRRLNVEENDFFRREMGKYLPAIREALTEDQWNRVQQLKVRFGMRLVGPSMAIFTGKLGTELEIPMEDRSKVFMVGTKLAEPLRKEARELKTQAVQRLTNLLTPAHRTELQEYFKRNRFQPESVDFGIFMWQLAQGAKNENNSDAPDATQETSRKNWEEDKFHELRAVGNFELSIAGTFEPTRGNVSEEWFQEYSHRKGWISLKILELLVQPEIAKPIELSDDQIAQCKHVLKEYHEQNNEMDRALQESQNPQKTIAQLRIKKAEAMASLDGLVEKVLMPHQIDWMEEYAGLVGMSRIGLVGALVDGRLGRFIGITEQEKKSLIQEAAKIRDELMQKSLESERKVYDELVEVLANHDAKRLKSQIGNPIEKGYASLDLLADQLLGKQNP